MRQFDVELLSQASSECFRSIARPWLELRAFLYLQPKRHGELDRKLIALHGTFGIDSAKINALARISANEVALSAGNAVVLMSKCKFRK